MCKCWLSAIRRAKQEKEIQVLGMWDTGFYSVVREGFPAEMTFK